MITHRDFELVRAVAFEQAAIVLERGKEYLVEARLTPLALREGFPTLSSFLSALRCQPSPGLLHSKIAESLTTNETSFFRDGHPFEALRRSILPELIAKRRAQRRLTIWSGACSTGQEPFSIAITIREYFPELADWRIDILATDYSPSVLRHAEDGRYNRIEVSRGLPPGLREKYFVEQGDEWQIAPEIRSMVEFKQLNLIGSWPALPSFDLIFLRNVMIYFDVKTKRSILDRIRPFLRRDGYLFLGSSETTLNIAPHWSAVTHDATVVYKLIPTPE